MKQSRSSEPTTDSQLKKGYIKRDNDGAPNSLSLEELPLPGISQVFSLPKVESFF